MAVRLIVAVPVTMHAMTVPPMQMLLRLVARAVLMMVLRMAVLLRVLASMMVWPKQPLAQLAEISHELAWPRSPPLRTTASMSRS